MKIFVFVAILFFPLASYSHNCESWEYGILYLSYDHGGTAQQVWQAGGKTYVWVEALPKDPALSGEHSASQPMEDYFGFKRKIVDTIDAVDAVGSAGWELQTRDLELLGEDGNTTTYMFKRCKAWTPHT